MSEQKQLIGNFVMTTMLIMEHDCTFTWRLRNLDLWRETHAHLGELHQEFTLHPKCDKTWRLTANLVADSLKVELHPVRCDCRVPTQTSELGICLNRNGEFINLRVPSKEIEKIAFDFILSFKEGKFFTSCDEEVELEAGNTLVVKGRLVVPSCCVRTETSKEETMEVPKATEPLDLCELIKEGFVVA